jgi:phosphoribosylaminoimidazole carboxylase (NCAIR synthetase)
MAKRKPGMSDAEWRAYAARVRRRAQQAAAAKAKAALPKVQVQVGVMTVTVETGPDRVLGTADDKVTIRPQETTAIVFNDKMTKAELLEVAEKLGVTGVTAKDKKADILAALAAL